ncbi:hypothetical protein F0562_016642 [Nyssa sinensis]|uniref:Uncharacterized protein n=1 Tax=Nyssa sinensis TaxID=561372 RepID=A0A5J4ZEE0_9ASTE|nr:hypothetical protein F0562_016642 [Nyssa sinensis]
MPSGVQSSNEHLEPVWDMGHRLEPRKSLRQQQTSKVVKETILSPRANRSLKSQDQCKVGSPFGQPYFDGKHEKRHSEGAGQSSGNHRRQRIGKNTNKDDELIKHMSNLPGYLQRVERGKNLQEKALNFGVLDWAHLEKWKYNQKHIPPRGEANASSCTSNSSFMASSSSSLSSTVQGKSLASHRRQTSLQSSHLNSSHGGGLSLSVKQSQRKVMQLEDLKSAPKNTLDRLRKRHWTDKASGRNYSEMKLEKGKKKDLNQKITSGKETSASHLRKREVSLSSKDMMSALDSSTKQRVEEFQASEFDLAHEHFPEEPKSIVLLLPKHSPKKSFSEVFQLSDPRASFDGKLTEAKQKSFPDDFFPEEVHSGELCSEILHSCPLLVRVETNTQSDMKPRSLISDQGMELPLDASQIHLCSNESPTMLSKGKSMDDEKSSRKPSTSRDTIETSRRLDQETAESTAAKGRQTSPDRLFSFSLGRMGRSFSFKESSSIPRLSSPYVTIKSGPLRPEASNCLDNSNGKKPNAHSRARSSPSPLRRLLDPLLKPKAANRHLSSETEQPLKGNLDSSTLKLINSRESLQDKKHEASTVEALLQLTIKNGLPFFKLLVDNSSDILAATMKNFTSGKDTSTWIYTFYSVHEIKKKSTGWINQGHKQKGCGIGYNIIGQMKVSSSQFSDVTVQSSNKQFAVRECVLYTVDPEQSDQETPKFMPNRELAAIVVKIPSENSNGDKELGNKGEGLIGRGCTGCLCEDRNSSDKGENENCNSMTVILPGGIHGLPNKGLPSPLINRWKSGGSCDCGGWDVGCNLRILTEHQSCTHSGPSTPRFAPDHLDLFVEGGAKKDRPIFSLAPFKKGIYSVEFKASISLLQAFSICVAFISSKKSSDVLEVNNLSEARLFQESAFSASDGMKTPTKVQRDVPMKYVPSLPPSPVGRV